MYNSTIHHLFIACEPTTQSQIFFRPHVCDSLYPSPLFPLVTAISLSLCLSSCSLFLLAHLLLQFYMPRMSEIISFLESQSVKGNEQEAE